MADEALPIHAAISAVMRDVAAVGIGKDKRNQAQNFDFRSIDNFYEVLGPICARHGVFTAPQLCEGEDALVFQTLQKPAGWTLATVRIRYRVFGPAGDHISLIVCGQGMDGGDKATNKALTAAHKWALTQLFMPPLKGGDDADGHSPATTVDEFHPVLIDSKTRASIVARIKALGGIPDEWKRQRLPIPKDLDVSDLRDALDILERAERLPNDRGKLAAAALASDRDKGTGQSPASNPAVAAFPDEEPF